MVYVHVACSCEDRRLAVLESLTKFKRTGRRGPDGKGRISGFKVQNANCKMHSSSKKRMILYDSRKEKESDADKIRTCEAEAIRSLNTDSSLTLWSVRVQPKSAGRKD